MYGKKTKTKLAEVQQAVDYLKSHATSNNLQWTNDFSCLVTLMCNICHLRGHSVQVIFKNISIFTPFGAFWLASGGATHPSGSMYWSNTGGDEAGSLLRAIMCWKVMSVCVLMFISCASPSGPAGLGLGILRNTCTMIGSLAVRKVSTACSWVALDRSLPFT